MFLFAFQSFAKVHVFLSFLFTALLKLFSYYYFRLFFLKRFFGFIIIILYIILEADTNLKIG